MKINGKQLTEKETLNYLRKEKRQLESGVITESVHNELRYLNSEIYIISTQLKIKKLMEKQSKVRSAIEFEKINKQITKLEEAIIKYKG